MGFRFGNGGGWEEKPGTRRDGAIVGTWGAAVLRPYMNLANVEGWVSLNLNTHPQKPRVGHPAAYYFRRRKCLFFFVGL